MNDRKIFSMTAKSGKIYLGVLDANAIDHNRWGLVTKASDQNSLRRVVSLLRKHDRSRSHTTLTGHLPPLAVVRRDGMLELWVDNTQGWGVGYNLYLMGVLSGIQHAQRGRSRQTAH